METREQREQREPRGIGNDNKQMMGQKNRPRSSPWKKKTETKDSRSRGGNY